MPLLEAPQPSQLDTWIGSMKTESTTHQHPKPLLKPMLLLDQSLSSAMPTQKLSVKNQAKHAEVSQHGKHKPFMVVLLKLTVDSMKTELTTHQHPKLLLKPMLLLDQSLSSAMPTQKLSVKNQAKHAEVSQHGKHKLFMAVLPRRNLLLKLKTHGESQLPQELHWPTHAWMPTRLLKLMMQLIKHAPLLVTQPGTPTPLQELDPKPMLLMPHTQTIPFTCKFLPTCKVTHGESHLLQELHWPTPAWMLTKLLKPMIQPIKHALLLVTLPGTPTPLQELDLKPPPLLHHTQIILSIEHYKEKFDEWDVDSFVNSIINLNIIEKYSHVSII